MQLSRFVELVVFRAYSDLRSEVARVSLGVAWWIVEPLLYLSVFYIVFGVVFQRGGEGFIYFLLAGLFVWRWFDSSVRAASVSILNNGALIRQVVVPKFFFPAVAVLVSLFKFFIVFTLFLLFMAFVHGEPTIRWLALPAVVGVQLLFTIGVAGILAALVPFLPDLKIIIDNLLTLWFFMSGVFFDISDVQGVFGQLLALNPMAQIISAYRIILLTDAWPDWWSLGIVVITSLLALLVSAWYYKKYDHLYSKLVF